MSLIQPDFLPIGPQRLSMDALAPATVVARAVTPESAFTPSCSMP